MELPTKPLKATPKRILKCGASLKICCSGTYSWTEIIGEIFVRFFEIGKHVNM